MYITIKYKNLVERVMELSDKNNINELSANDIRSSKLPLNAKEANGANHQNTNIRYVTFVMQNWKADINVRRALETHTILQHITK